MEINWSTKVTNITRVILEGMRYFAENHLLHSEDIQQLNNYLQDSISKLDLSLTDIGNFKQVDQVIEAKLVLYNSRRTGEIQAIRYGLFCMYAAFVSHSWRRLCRRFPTLSRQNS